MSGLGRFLVYSGFGRWDCKFCLVEAGFWYTEGSVDCTVKSVWLGQVFGLLRVQ
jgi:hypothetical protein